MSKEPAPKKPLGRPVDPKYLEEIKLEATPKDVAVAIMRRPPKKDWRFLAKPKPR